MKKDDAWLRFIANILFYSLLLKVLNLLVNVFKAKGKAPSTLAFPYITVRKARNFQILVYHRVNDDDDPFFPAVPTEVLRRQMGFLSAHFNVLPLEQVVELAGRNDVPENAVVVTFDDGYRDNYLNAFPVLNSLSIPATIFLATDGIGTGEVLWHDRVFTAFRESRRPVLKMDCETPRDLPLGTVQEKLAAQDEVLRYLRALSQEERLRRVDELVKELEVHDSKRNAGLMLSWEEIRIMSAANISFGSHTLSHAILSRQTEDAARLEIQNSKALIESQLKKPVTTFAYPNGRAEDFNTQTKAILRDSGYSCAVTTIFGANECGGDPYELRRGGPWERHLPLFGLKMNWYKFAS